MDTNSTRRDLLKAGIAAASGMAIAPHDAAFAQSNAAAVVTKQRFRGWVSRGSGAGRTTLQDLTLRPISGRQVVVRTEVHQSLLLEYRRGAGHPAERRTATTAERDDGQSATTGRGRPPTGFGRLSQMALIQGHGGVGTVEAVGPDVRRVQVGDRVCVSGTPQCGHCYQCLRGRADMCQFLGRQGPDDLVAIADMSDGTPVFANSHIGGLAEKMVTFEEWVVPIFTKATAVDLGMVCSCVSVAGLGATTSQNVALVEPGSIVAVVGCGPLGLSAVQGARISGASTIVAIDPIRARREVALKTGATHALDPNVEGTRLVERYASSRADRATGCGQVVAMPVVCSAALERTSSSKRLAPMRFRRSSKQVRIRPAFFRCDRRTR